MIDNEYIKELELSLDTAKLKAVIVNHQYKERSELVSHQRFVFDDEYMQELYKTFPWMGSIYNIYTQKNGQGFPIHIDAKRECAVNIPISGVLNSHTIFYEPDEEIITELSKDERGLYVRSKVKESFRFTLAYPTIINTTRIHSVTVQPNVDRVIISWGSTLNFEDTKKEFNKVLDKK